MYNISTHRIRTVISSWGSLGAEGEEESEDGGLFMEETLCYEISRRASDFHDKLRKCLQVCPHVSMSYCICINYLSLHMYRVKRSRQALP